uniref:Uncharacterized protein n=1 Tax=Opuntia streptacantha TaxID=393608 RepID=A0A7C9FAA4_OPUST
MDQQPQVYSHSYMFNRFDKYTYYMQYTWNNLILVSEYKPPNTKRNKFWASSINGGIAVGITLLLLLSIHSQHNSSTIEHSGNSSEVDQVCLSTKFVEARVLEECQLLQEP